PPLFERENHLRKESDNLRRRSRLRAPDGWCRRRNKRNRAFAEVRRTAWFYLRPTGRRRQIRFRSAKIYYSRFCTCSRIFSSSVLHATTRCAISASFAFAPRVLNSRKIS